jgi:hypothetical protein
MGTRSFLALMVVALCLGLLALWYFDTSRHYRLAIAAGQRTGQAFQIAKALQEVTHRHYPDVTIEVYETRGSLHNVRLIDNGAAQLARFKPTKRLGAKPVSWPSSILTRFRSWYAATAASTPSATSSTSALRFRRKEAANSSPFGCWPSITSSPVHGSKF